MRIVGDTANVTHWVPFSVVLFSIGIGLSSTPLGTFRWLCVGKWASSANFSSSRTKTIALLGCLDGRRRNGTS